jgi:hypothetical protein
MLRHLHRHHWRWYILITIILATYPIVVSLTILGSSLGSLLAGSENLEEARSVLLTNPSEAQRLFTDADKNLTAGVTILQQAPWYTQLLTPLPPFRWQVQLTKASHALAASGTITSALLASYPQSTGATDPSTLLSQSSDQFVRWYSANTASFDALQTQLTTAHTELQAVPNWIIPGHTRDLYTLKTEVTGIADELPFVRTLIGQATQAFGSEDASPHTFLVLFQNDNELRMSGGFFGSYATLTASGGRIRQYRFGEDIYKLDKTFTERTKYHPPDQLATITPNWGFRDSNVGAAGFLPNYSLQIEKFYEEASSQKISGIIYVNSSILENILQVTGPVTLPGANTQVTADTVSDALTQYIEQDYFNDPVHKQINESKSILNDLLPILLAKLHEQPGSTTALLPGLHQALLAKSIQFWSTAPGLESSLQHFLPPDSVPTGNWIKVIQNNLGGLKSSRSVKEDVDIVTHTNLFHGTTQYDVTITRTHEGTGAWPDGENVNYSEIYLPPTASITLLPENHGGKSSLPEADQRALGTFGKEWQTTVEESKEWKRVSFWSTTSVGEMTTYTLGYTLPNTENFNTSLTYLKQAGTANETVRFNGFSYKADSNLSIAL